MLFNFRLEFKVNWSFESLYEITSGDEETCEIRSKI
jgi:hypothetical protein